jgi:hypothetical protein
MRKTTCLIGVVVAVSRNGVRTTGDELVAVDAGPVVAVALEVLEVLDAAVFAPACVHAASIETTAIDPMRRRGNVRKSGPADKVASLVAGA